MKFQCGAPPIAEKRPTERLLTAIAALGLLFAVAQPAEALDTSPSAIVADPARFNGQTVTLHGTITNLRESVSRRGNPYYTFDLSDGKQTIRVFSFGKAPCRAGATTVQGTFEQVKQVGRLTFHDEVNATEVTCRGAHEPVLR